MEKYIFLDFDGVINTPKGKFAKKAVANLLHLVEKSDAKIIISSTWRLQGMEYIQQLWQEYHLPGEVIGLTPSCNSTNFSNVDGQEEWQGLHGCKGLEIAEWLRLNAKEPYRYIILDDEEDFLFSQREHLVKVEGSKGLDKADVRVAIQILKTKEISQMKRWFYGALKFIAVYILMVMLFMAYFYWYPEKEMNNMNRRALMYQNTLSLSLRLLPTITLSEKAFSNQFLALPSSKQSPHSM